MRASIEELTSSNLRDGRDSRAFATVGIWDASRFRNLTLRLPRNAMGHCAQSECDGPRPARRRCEVSTLTVSFRSECLHRSIRRAVTLAWVSARRLCAACRPFWRMGWDSNPRDPCGSAGFQDRCFQPLSHPSAEQRGMNPAVALAYHVHTHSVQTPLACVATHAKI